MFINKYLYTAVLWTFIILLPFWISNLTLENFLITYAVYWVFGDFVMSIFLHRWAAHNLWKPPIWFQNVVATVGVMICQGNPISWAAWHRTHHKHVDTDKDPHSPKNHSWFYIVFLNHFHDAEYRLGVDKARNNYFVFLNKYEGFIAVLTALMLYLILPFEWFLVVWVAPVALLGIIPGLVVNYFCHYKGQVRDNIWLWPLVFSDCLHKEHHDNVKLKRSCLDPFASLIIKLGYN